MADSDHTLDEKHGQDPAAQPSKNPEHHHHHHLPFHHLGHRSHRLAHLIHPSGKHYHIVHNPTEVEPKRRELEKDPKGAFANNYDIVVYGSPEHLSCIKDVREHHLERRDNLRSKNNELFEEFDEVHEALNHLSDELGRLTDHAVGLDASFSKFGYSARIRTKDDAEAASLNSEESEGGQSAESRHKDRSLEPIRLVKNPTIRQYFHKNVLWRSARSGEVGSFELFTDLIYVGVIDYVGEAAVSHASAESFLHFVILFSLAYKIWSDLTVTVNWFEVEDVFGRLCIIFILCCLYGFNSNVEYFFEDTYTAGIAFYLTQRLYLTTVYVIFSITVPMIRGTLLSHASLGIVASVLYIISIHVEYPNRLAPLFLGLFVDYAGGVMMIMIVRLIKKKDGCNKTCSTLAKNFEFLPAINIEHRVERTSAFTTLVFGYSILKSLYQSHAHIGVNSFLGKGLLVIVQAFVICWTYFDTDALPVHVHAIRRHWFSSSIWITSHLPLSGAFILASSTLTDLVLAHDCANANPEDLADAYITRSVAELDQPMRWFYCGGLSVTLFFMTAISFCHIHKKIARPRLTKRIRLLIRLCVCAILACLPLAHKLTSLDLISISCSLFVFVLVVDLVGNSCPGERFFTGGWGNCPETRCKYSAKLKIGKKRRAELERRFLNGEHVSLEDALQRSLSTDSFGSETTLDVGEEWHGGHL